MPVPEDVPQGESQNLDDGIGVEDVDVVEGNLEKYMFASGISDYVRERYPWSVERQL